MLLPYYSIGSSYPARYKPVGEGARFVYRDYSRESSVTSMLSDLNWLPLSKRREYLRLSFFHKASLGLNAVDLSQYATLSTGDTRRNHSQKYNHFSVRTDVFKYSFFPRTIPAWNNLPEHIVNTKSTESFRTQVLSFLA